MTASYDFSEDQKNPEVFIKKIKHDGITSFDCIWELE